MDDTTRAELRGSSAGHAPHNVPQNVPPHSPPQGLQDGLPQPCLPQWATRWMVRRDFDAVLPIEQDSFPEPWSENDFCEEVRHPLTIGRVAIDAHDRVVGYFVYTMAGRAIELENFAVAASYRRQGVGRMMLQRVVAALSPKRKLLRVVVADYNLAAQLFFRARGLRCTAIEHAYARFRNGTPLDGYRFEIAWGDQRAVEAKESPR